MTADIGQIILWVGASCTTLIAVSRALLELAKLTPSTKDDKFFNTIIKYTTKVFEIISGIKNTLEIELTYKKNK